MNGQTIADALSAIGAFSVLAGYNLLTSSKPGPAAISARATDPLRGIGARLVLGLVSTSAFNRTKTILMAFATAKLPRLALKRLSTVFANARDIGHPLVIFNAAANWGLRIFSGTSPCLVDRGDVADALALIGAETAPTSGHIGWNIGEGFATHLANTLDLPVLVHPTFAALCGLTIGIRTARSALSHSLTILQTDCGLIIPQFGGSGTTQVVARELGRHSLYIDASREYADMAIKRYEATPVALPLPLHQPAPIAEQLALEER